MLNNIMHPGTLSPRLDYCGDRREGMATLTVCDYCHQRQESEGPPEAATWHIIVHIKDGNTVYGLKSLDSCNDDLAKAVLQAEAWSKVWPNLREFEELQRERKTKDPQFWNITLVRV